MTELSIEGVSGEDGKGRLTSFAGETLEALIDRAFAPGTPLKIAVDGMNLSGKSLGTRRLSQDPPQFRLRARMTNLRRGDRDRLASLAG